MIDEVKGADLSFALGIEGGLGKAHCMENPALKVEFTIMTIKAGLTASIGGSYKVGHIPALSR